MGGAPGVEFMDRPDGLAASKFVALAGCHGQRSGQAAPALQAAADSQNGSTQGLRLSINPDSRPWVDAANGYPGAR